MDWDFQYYIAVIFPELIYGILIKCLHKVGGKFCNLSIIFTKKEPREDTDFDKKRREFPNTRLWELVKVVLTRY